MRDARELVIDLAQVEEGPPIVTLYLETRWKDEHQRARVRLFFHDRAREAYGLFSAETPEFKGIRHTLERLERFVDGLVNQDVEPGGHGVMVCASEPRGLFETCFVGAEFEPAMFIDARPRLYPMIEALALIPSAHLVSVSIHGIHVVELKEGRPGRTFDLDREVPVRHKAGGWSQLKIQHRQRGRVQAVWDECASFLDRLQRETGPASIVLFGQEFATRNFLKQLPETLVARVVSFRPAPRTRDELLEAGREALLDDRLAREFSVVHHILGQGLSDRSGTVGLEDTLHAMNERRVKLLALTRRFDALGFACAQCGAVWMAGATGCNFCGGRTTLVSLREELVRRALRDHVDIVVAPETSPLNRYRGIGAILRRLSGEAHQKLGGAQRMPESALPSPF
jgi:hypothetical protein